MRISDWSSDVCSSDLALVASIWRLRGDARVAHGGTAQLYLHRLRTWTVTRVVLGAAGLAAVLLGAASVAVVVLLAPEVVGRWPFYVTVLPSNMTGPFWPPTAGCNRQAPEPGRHSLGWATKHETTWV